MLYGHFYPLYNARQKQLSEQNRSAEMPLLHVSSPNCPIVEVGLRLSGPLPYWKAALDVLVVTSQHMDYLVKYHVSNPSHPVYFVVSHPLSLSFRHPNIYCSSFPGPIVTKSAQPPVKRIIPPLRCVVYPFQSPGSVFNAGQTRIHVTARLWDLRLVLC